MSDTHAPTESETGHLSPVERGRKGLARTEARLLEAVKAQAVADMRLVDARENHPDKTWSASHTYRQTEAATADAIRATMSAHRALIHIMAQTRMEQEEALLQ